MGKQSKNLLYFRVNKKGLHVSAFLTFLKAVVKPFYFLLKPFRYYGSKKVKDGACIYVGNHYTLFDCLYVVCTTKEGVHLVAKKEVFDNPFLGFLARRVKAISVSRDGKDVRPLLNCFKCLNNDEKICIYPEGTRNKSGKGLLPFKHGAALMAIRCKKPIQLVVMYEKPKFFRCAHILVGEPFELTEYYDRKLLDEEVLEADNKIRQKMLDLIEEHKVFLENKKKKKVN